ncbi:MAG: hypothetical protein ACOCY5_02910 [Desulfohalobiaceae bacterium]
MLLVILVIGDIGRDPAVSKDHKGILLVAALGPSRPDPEKQRHQAQKSTAPCLKPPAAALPTRLAP